MHAERKTPAFRNCTFSIRTDTRVLLLLLQQELYDFTLCDCVLFAGVQIKSQIGQFVWIRNKASFPDRDATHAEVREIPQLARASRSDRAMESSHEIGYRLTNCIFSFLRLSVLRAYNKKGTRTLKTEISDVIRSEKG